MGSEGWGVRVRGDRDKLGWLPEKSRGGTVATHISESLASFTSSGRTTFLTCFSSTLRIISCKEQNMQPCFQTLKSYSEVEVETHEPHSQATHFDKGESLGMSLQELHSGVQKCNPNVKLYYLPHIFNFTSFQSPLDETGNELSIKCVSISSWDEALMACSKYRTVQILL